MNLRSVHLKIIFVPTQISELFKIIKKAYRLFLLFFDLILLLYISVILSVQFPLVQNALALRLTGLLSEQLNCHISIEKVKLDYLSRVVIKNLYIEDQQGDSLLSAYKVDLSYSLRPLLDNQIRINGLCLTDANIQLKKTKGSEKLNADFIFKLFSSSDTTKSAIDLSLKDLEIVNGRFIYNDENEKAKSYGFDPSHIDLSKLDLIISDFSFDGDQFTAGELNLSLFSSGTFNIEHLNASVEAGPTGIKLGDLKLKTPDSDINGRFMMNTEDWSDYSEFIKKVRFNTDFRSSKIAMSDIAYFVPNLKGMTNAPSFSGVIKGSISKLRGKNIELSIGKHTSLNLSFELNGLPDIQETFFYLDIKRLRSSKRGIEQIRLPSSGKRKSLQLPSQLEKLGQVEYKGSVSGYLSDLVAYGHLRSDIGQLYTDISLKQSDELEYSGYIKADNLQIGRLFEQQNELKSISLEAKIKGSGIDKESFDARIDGRISRIELSSYTFHNIEVAGNLSTDKFHGDVSIEDRNLNLAFIGSIDLSNEEKQFNFMAEIDNFRPFYILKSAQFDSSAIISSTVNIDVLARDLNSLIGRLDIYNTSYLDANDTVIVNNFSFESNRIGEQKDLSLRSDIADFNIRGKFNMLDNYRTIKSVLQKYASNLVSDTIKIEKSFDFEVEIKDFSLIKAIVAPDLWLDSHSVISGSFDNKSDQLKVNALLVGLKNGGLKIDTCLIDLGTSHESLNLSSSFFIHRKGKTRRKITLLSTLKENSIETIMQSRGGGSFATDFNFNTEIHDANTFDFKIKDSRFLLGDSIWYFDNDNKITYDSNQLIVTNLKIYKNNEFVKINGSLSSNPEDQINLETSDFNLVVLNAFLENSHTEIQGIVNGKASVRDFYNERLFESNLNFKDLGFNKELIGSGDINSIWNGQLKRLEVDGRLDRGDTNTFNLTGYYDTKNKVSPLHFDLKLAFLPLLTIEPLTIGILSDFKGIMSTVLKLRGSTSEPELTGHMGIINAGAHIDYLNTTYQFVNSEDKMVLIPIHFKEDLIRIPAITLVDEFGNTGRAGMTFVHDKFKKMNMGIHLLADKLLLLNTNNLQNDLYYGKAFVSGKINIEMKEGLTRLDMDITTESGTKLSLPLESSTEVIENEFVVFTKSKEQIENALNEKVEEKEKPFNIEVKLKVKAVPGSQMRMVFDEDIGDVLRAEGTGEILVTYDQKSGLNLFGEYIIESGDYLFTLESLISKRFYIEQGSSIKWNGSPFQGQMNISTSYKLRAKLKNIIPDIYDDVNYERMTPIELRLNMESTVESPAISFDINLPNTNENGRSQLRSALSTENCLNQQVFSLLILNSFTQCEVFGEEVNYAVGENTAYEAMSNQLSNWLSKISDDVDVGFTYRPELSTEKGEISPEQVEVALSTQLFDDRLIIDGNVGYGDQSLTSTENSSDVVGEFSIEYKIRPDGRLRVKAFNHVNDRSYIENDNLYVQGVGISYQREYNKFGELMREMFGKKEKKPEVEEE